MALADRAGARLAAAAGVSVSRHIVLRLARAMLAPETGQVTVFGVDDGAVRRGYRYATVLAGMGTNEIIDLLEG